MQHLDGNADDARSDSGCSGKTESSSVFSEESQSEENAIVSTTQTHVQKVGAASESAKRGAAHQDFKEETVRSLKRLQLCRCAEELGARTEEIEQALEDEQDSKAALVALVIAKIRQSRERGDSEREAFLPQRLPEESVAEIEQKDKIAAKEESKEESKEEFKEEKHDTKEEKEELKKETNDDAPTKEEAQSSQSSSNSDSSEGEKEASKGSSESDNSSESKQKDSESSPEDSDDDAETKAGSEDVHVESRPASISPPSKEDKASMKVQKAGQAAIPPRKRLRIGTKSVEGSKSPKECQDKDRKDTKSEPLKISKRLLEAPIISEKPEKPTKLKIRQTSSRRKAPEAVETPKDLAGEWFYNKGREKYELLIDDDSQVIFKQESFSAEGPLQLNGGWWEGDIKIGIIRLQPDPEGNIVSQFKKSHKREWGTLRIACRKEHITKRQKTGTADHPDSARLPSKKRLKVQTRNESTENFPMERVGDARDRAKAKRHEPGPKSDENVGEPGGLMISKLRSSRRRQAVIADRPSPEGFDGPRYPGARRGKRLKDSDESSSEPEVPHRSRPKVERQKPQTYHLGMQRGKPCATRTQNAHDSENDDAGGEAFEYTSVADKKAERNSNLKRALSLFQTWMLSTRTPQHEEKLRRRGMLSTTLDVKLEGVWQYKFEKDVARFETKANHREQGTVVSITAEGRRKFKERHQMLWDSTPLPVQATNAKASEAEAKKDKALSSTMDDLSRQQQSAEASAGTIQSQSDILESTSPPEPIANLDSDASIGIASSWPGGQSMRTRLKQAVGFLKDAVGLSSGLAVEQRDSECNSNCAVHDATLQGEALPNSETVERATPLEADAIASEVVQDSVSKLEAEDEPSIQGACSNALRSDEHENSAQSSEALPRNPPRPERKLKRIANSSDEEELSNSTTSKTIQGDTPSSSALQEHAMGKELHTLTTDDCSMVEHITSEGCGLSSKQSNQASEPPKELELVVSQVIESDAPPLESSSPREVCNEREIVSVKESAADQSDADQVRTDLGSFLQAETEKDAVAHRERLAKTLADRASLIDAPSSSSSTQTQTVQASSAQVLISKLPPVPQDAPARTISEAQAKLEQNLPAVEVAKLVHFLASQPMDRSTLIATKIPQTLNAVKKKFSADPEIVNTSAALLRDWRTLFRQAL